MTRKILRWILTIPMVGIFCVAAFATQTTDKISYGTSTAISCTFGSLTASATVGRSSVAVDETTNLAVDAYVVVVATSGIGAVGGSSAINVFVYGGDNASPANYDEEEGISPNADASYTINANTNFKLAATLLVTTASKEYNTTFSVASKFGGVLPPHWGIIVVNNAGQTLAGGAATYSNIFYTNQ